MKTKLINLLVAGIVFLICNAARSQSFPNIDYIEKYFPGNAKTCEKIEFIFHLDRLVAGNYSPFPPPNNYMDPHNPDEVNMFMRFTNGSKTIDVNAFYDELVTEDPNYNNCQWQTLPVPATQANFFPNAQYIKYLPSAVETNPNSPFFGKNKGQRWIVRHAFRLNETGLWSVELHIRDRYSPGTNTFFIHHLNPIIIEADPISKGFVVKPQATNSYLGTENGDLLFLMGMNENWSISDKDYLCRMKEVIKTSSKDNVNFFHVWLSSTNNDWGFTPGINGSTFCKSCDDNNLDGNDEEFHSSVFNSKNAYKIDQYIDFAEQYNTYIQLCLFINEGSDKLNDNGTPNPQKAYFSYRNPYYIDNPDHIPTNSWRTVNSLNYFRFPNTGEPGIKFTDPPTGNPEGSFAFFDATSGLKNRIKIVLRYCAARWGYARNLVAWELGSEINHRDTFVMVYNPTDLKSGTPNPRSVKYTIRKNDYSTLITTWHMAAKASLLAMDANKHLITTNFTLGDGPFSQSFVKPTFANLSYSTAHLYYNDPRVPYSYEIDNSTNNWFFKDAQGNRMANGTTSNNAPQMLFDKYAQQEFSLFETTRAFINELNQPFQVQEWGPAYRDPNNQLSAMMPGLYNASYAEDDPHGIQLHNVIFSNAFSGAMGTPLPYDLPFESIQPKNQYYHYRGLGNFFKQFNNSNNLGQISQAFFERNNVNTVPQIWDGGSHEYDSNIEGLRYAYMFSSNGSILGWCQDKKMAFSHLFWHNKKYLQSLDRSDLVSDPNISRSFSIKTGETLPFFYTVDWFDTREGQIINSLRKTIQSTMDLNGNHVLNLALPDILFNSTFGDGMFIVKKALGGSFDYSINAEKPVSISTALSSHYTEDLNIKLNCSDNVYAIEIIVNQVDANGNNPQSILSKQLMLNTVGGPQGEFELNTIIRNNTTKPYLPIVNNGPTFYSVKIKNRDPEVIQLTNGVVPGEKTYFVKIEGCNASSQLSVNGFTGSNLSNPILVNFAEPIMVDGRGSVGENGFRIIINEINSSGTLLGNEYNKLFSTMKCKTVFNANDIVEELHHANEKFLPGDGPGNSRLWRIDFVTFNSYSPATGCSSWENATEYVRVNCETTTDLQVPGNTLTNGFYEYDYAEPVMLDATQTTGERGYRIIVQECDANKNLFGPEIINIPVSGEINEVININDKINNISGGSVPFLEPDINGARYYKIKIAAYNSWDGGCDIWDEQFVFVKIKSCHLQNEFALNNYTSYNSASTPYQFEFNESIMLNTDNSKSETNYEIKLSGIVDGSSVSYSLTKHEKLPDQSLPLSAYMKQMTAYTTQYGTSLPLPNVVWKLDLILSNDVGDDKGCDHNITKTLYFKTVVNLNGGFNIDNDNITYPCSTGVANTYVTFCDNEEVILKNQVVDESVDSYEIIVSEVEWQNSSFIDFNRPHPISHWENNWTKSYSKVFKGKFDHSINLSDFIYEFSGSDFDKNVAANKYYKVTLKQYSWGVSSYHFLVFKFKECLSPNPLDSMQNNADNNKDQQNLNTSIAPISLNLRVLPNPSGGKFRIAGTETGRLLNFDRVRIINCMGQEVISIMNAGSDKVFDLENLSQGIYFIEIEMDHKKKSLKWIKQ